MKSIIPISNGTAAAKSAASRQTEDSNNHKEIVDEPPEKAKTKCGSAKRKRGPKPALVPSRRHLEILLATRSQTYEAVGAARGISRQRVAEIAHRWREYLPIRPLPKRHVVENSGNGKPKGKKENRIHVISFRLTDSEFRLLRSRYPEVKSVDRAARGVVTKFLSI